MSVKDDLLIDKDSILDEENSGKIESAEKFSYRQDELEGNNPSWDCGACGDSSTTTSC
jgi:hypothetical protein